MTNTKFKELSEEMSKLEKQIKTVLDISDFDEPDNLEEWLDSFGRVRNADDIQKLEEYHKMLLMLDDVQDYFKYYNYSVKEVSRLHKGESGRYETDGGWSYGLRSQIEFLRTEKLYNYDTDSYEEVQIWTTSWLAESENGKYYIEEYPDIELEGLEVRVRTGEAEDFCLEVKAKKSKTEGIDFNELVKKLRVWEKNKEDEIEIPEIRYRDDSRTRRGR